ncbi:hypothetical protein CYMTET_23876 [Cymbomonas tetramitiformis]|uniref:Aldehyde dehydrogenase domain-containing protein n=1 Tax=Cymbomonas tetramitiformis TaxID=36881 RepID=A0AAE0L0G9_9CHLO|nr:hypothetical protein CYMTET_23876 [Cymbomonas tetramitiformis]
MAKPSKGLATAGVLLFTYLAHLRTPWFRHLASNLKTRGVTCNEKGLASIVVFAALSSLWKSQMVSLAKYLVFGKKLKFAGMADGELGFLDSVRAELLRLAALAMGKFSTPIYPPTTLPTWHLSSPPTLPAKTMQSILQGLDTKKVQWASLPNKLRAVYLRDCIKNLIAVSEDLAAAAAACKGGYEAGIAEERLVAVGAVKTMREFAEVLEGGAPKVHFYKRESGQWVANTFPACWWENVFFSGWRGEVWVEPGKGPTQSRLSPGADKAGITCVLGAGNQYNLTIEDIVTEMFTHNKVVICKINPVLGFLQPFLQQIFEPLISLGYLAILDGGVAEGQYLCNSDFVSRVHMTGSAATWDAIVWQGKPKVGKPPFPKFCGGELGGVTPFMVVPGNWSRLEMQYQAKNIVSGLVFNASHNCLAAQVLVTARHWPQRAQFLNAVRAEMRKARPRASFYPGTKEKYDRFFAEYPQAEGVSPKGEEGTYPWVLAVGVPAE